MTKTRMISKILMLAALASTCSCGSNEDCDVKTCVDLASGRTTNGKSYEKCYSGSSPMTVTLYDANGKNFFQCTDEPGKTCTEATVNTLFAYCEVR